MNNLLFPEKVIEGYRLRPMTLGQIQELVPYIQLVVTVMKQSKITVENVQENMDTILFCLLPVMPDIIKIVIKEDDNIIKSFGAEKAAVIFREIVFQNIIYLKNLCRPLEGAMKEILSNPLNT